MVLAIYFITGIILAGLAFLYPKRKSAVVVTLFFIMVQVMLAVVSFVRKDSIMLQYFTFDPLAVIFLALQAFISTATFFHCILYTSNSGYWHRSLFYSSFIVLNISLTGVYAANNLIISWIFIELTTLSVAFLINHNRGANSLEATWKYIFICSLGIALAYIGILFASVTSSVEYSGDMSFDKLKYAFIQINPVYLKMAFLLILAGYSSKMEVFPLYTVGIDANYVAPAPVSAFISTAMVNGGFVAFFRLFSSMSDAGVGQWMDHILLITGFLSIIVAAIYMQKATNLKRVFAYSTVEHMGLVLIALSLGKPGIYIALFQITIHSFVKAGLFFQTGILHRVLKSYKLFKSGGYFQINQAGAIILLTGVVLITALPPSGLFLSEFMLFRELIASSLFLFIFLVLLLTIIFYGVYLKNSKILFGDPFIVRDEEVVIKRSEYYSQILFFAIAVLLCFYVPGFINELFLSVSGLGDNFFLPIINL